MNNMDNMNKTNNMIKPNNINNINNENYWFHDLTTLTKNYMNIIPRMEMTYPQKVNSLIRLLIIVGIVLSIIYHNHLFLYIPVLGMLVTYTLYLFREQEFKTQLNTTPTKHHTQNNNKSLLNGFVDSTLIDKFEGYLDDVKYTQPDNDNPFMNPLPFDNRKRKPATNTLNNKVKQSEVEVLFDYGNYRDVNDIFDKNNSKRQFFTMPWTTYPNDQGGFANWLYKTPPTCKEGNGAQCVANYYTPLNRNLITPGKGSSI